MSVPIDIGISGSSSASSGNQLNSPFQVTGGGGSAAQTFGMDSPITGTGTPSGAASWLPWAIVGAVALGLVVVLFLFNKRKR